MQSRSQTQGTPLGSAPPPLRHSGEGGGGSGVGVRVVRDVRRGRDVRGGRGVRGEAQTWKHPTRRKPKAEAIPSTRQV